MKNERKCNNKLPNIFISKIRDKYLFDHCENVIEYVGIDIYDGKVADSAENNKRGKILKNFNSMETNDFFLMSFLLTFHFKKIDLKKFLIIQL